MWVGRDPKSTHTKSDKVGNFLQLGVGGMPGVCRNAKNTIKLSHTSKLQSYTIFESWVENQLWAKSGRKSWARFGRHPRSTHTKSEQVRNFLQLGYGGMPGVCRDARNTIKLSHTSKLQSYTISCQGSKIIMSQIGKEIGSVVWEAPEIDSPKSRQSA